MLNLLYAKLCAFLTADKNILCDAFCFFIYLFFKTTIPIKLDKAKVFHASFRVWIECDICSTIFLLLSFHAILNLLFSFSKKLGIENRYK